MLLHKGDNMNEYDCSTLVRLVKAGRKLKDISSEELVGLMSSTPEFYMPLIYSEVSRRISED
jgi:hypothetical protein